MRKPMIPVRRKKRGRPPTGVDPMISIRLPTAAIGAIDAWARSHDMTRSDAIRAMIERGLKAKG